MLIMMSLLWGLLAWISVLGSHAHAAYFGNACKWS